MRCIVFPYASRGRAGIKSVKTCSVCVSACIQPQAVDPRDEIALDQAFDYYDTVVHSDINRADHVQKNPERAKWLMRSYARNQGAQTPNTVLVQGISVNGEASMDAETVPLYSHSFLIICPISCLIFPYMICLLYFGANTI